MKEPDFGCYGKGAAGYAHYKQDFDRIHGGGSGGSGGGPGCLGCLVLLVGIPVMTGALALAALVLDRLF